MALEGKATVVRPRASVVIFVAWTLVLLVALALGGCGPRDGPTSGAGQALVLTLKNVDAIDVPCDVWTATRPPGAPHPSYATTWSPMPTRVVVPPHGVVTMFVRPVPDRVGVVSFATTPGAGFQHTRMRGVDFTASLTVEVP